MSETKPTKEQFEKYISIRDSGLTNMFDLRAVVELSEGFLTRNDCIYIMKHFGELADEYEVKI